MPNILIVEDDEIMLKAIKNILSKDGYGVTIAKDGKEAFDRLDKEEYDIVITDLMMPYASGLEIINKIRNSSLKEQIGIIIISSVSSEETITEAFNLGADDYLKKPIMAVELLIRIRKLLANRKVYSKPISKPALKNV